MRARTLSEVVEHIYANTKPEGGCLVTTAARMTNGYGAQKFQGKRELSHRLVARHYLGPCPDGMEVRHLCGRGHEGCVTASHLRYGTRSENIHDAIRHGTYRQSFASGRGRGNKWGRASRKFPPEQVQEIRARYKAGGHTHRSLAAEYGADHTTIGDILRKESYEEV